MEMKASSNSFPEAVENVGLEIEQFPKGASAETVTSMPTEAGVTV